MPAAGSNACLKIFLIIVNLFFLLVGATILGVGVYFCFNVNLGRYSDVFSGLETLRSVRYLLIACGLFIVLIALCGCVGTCKENRCLIIVYIILLILILLGNIAAVALAIVYNGQVKNYVVEQMKDQLKRNYGSWNSSNGGPAGNQQFTAAIDALQTEEQCCGWTGLNSTNFYPSTPWYQHQQQRGSGIGLQIPQQFPDSCCAQGIARDTEKRDKCVRAVDQKKARDDGFMHADDCSDKLIALNGRFMQAVLGSVVLAILLQLICITCSILIVRQISNSDNRGLHV